MNGVNNYTGVFSWKFPMKTGLSADMVNHLIKDETVDIISFCQQQFVTKQGKAFKYLEFTEIVHPGFMQGFNILCDYLGLKVQEPKCVVYSNFFLAKEEIYKEYVNTILVPAVEFLEREENKWFAWKDSGYQNRGGLKPEQLKKYTGLDYYPMMIFLLERLMSIWIDNRELTYKIINKI